MQALGQRNGAQALPLFLLSFVNLNKFLDLPEPQAPAQKTRMKMQAPSSSATILKPQSF